MTSDGVVKLLTLGITPALALIGVWLTSRAGKAASESAQVLAAWKEMVDPIRAELASVRADLTATQHRLTGALDALDTERRWRQAAAVYIRELVRTHPNPPAPPPGFKEE